MATYLDARRRAKTTYGVTDRGVLIASGAFSPTLESLSVGTLTDVTLAQRPDGSGTVTFGPTGFTAGMYAGMSWPGVAQPPAFELIPDAKRVYDFVREAQARFRAPAA